MQEKKKKKGKKKFISVRKKISIFQKLKKFIFNSYFLLNIPDFFEKKNKKKFFKINLKMRIFNKNNQLKMIKNNFTEYF